MEDLRNPLEHPLEAAGAACHTARRLPPDDAERSPATASTAPRALALALPAKMLSLVPNQMQTWEQAKEARHAW